MNRRAVRALAIGAALTLTLTVVVACGRDHPRVLVLGFDGLDPQTVDLLLSEGKLPSFAKMRLNGAHGRLRADEPLLSPVLWTTVATGRSPADHGIGHFTALDPKSGQSLPVTSDLRRVRAIWNLLTERQRRSVVVGWWATWPPEPIAGAMVSDHFAYHFLFGDGLAGGDPTVKTHPPELEKRLDPLRLRPTDVGQDELAPFANVPAAELARPLDLADDLSHLRWIVATTETYRRIGLELWRSEKPDLEMVYFEGTDSVAHLFGHLFRAQGLAGELAGQQARYGRAVEAMYERADAILGDFLEALDDDTTLVVLSDHGFELGALPDDPSRLRDMRRVSEKFHRPEGVLLLYGRGVKPGARIEGATQLDVVPTILAALDLPAGADMPGRTLDEGFVSLAPPERIASWEASQPPAPAGSRSAATAAVPRDAAADAALLEHLKGLGYLGGAPAPAKPPGDTSAVPAGRSSPQAERNLAAIDFERRDYVAAERRYRALVAADPRDAGLRSSLAGVLGAQGRDEEALAELDAALALDPINPEGYHNKAVILERRGQRSEAIELYRTAVKYRPDFAPSSQALLRLTGSAEPRAPRDEAERKAVALCAEASAAAKRGAYAEALAKLDEAKRVAPRLALVHQYEANVAYLAGDKARAIAALERALALEPGNALFRHNLEELRKK